METPDNIVPFVDGQPGAGAAGGEGDRAQSWIDAAKTSTVPQQSAALKEEIASEKENGNSPTVITPVPHTGLRGFIDKSLDELAGTHGVKLAHDNDGQLYIQHPMLTRGQQWLKIGMEALAGAGAGLKAGKGAGNRGGAGVAGVQTGLQMNQDQEDREEKYRLEVANSQALAHTHAVQQLQMTREGIKFDRETSDYYDGKYNAALSIPGAQDLGKVNNPSELAKLMHENPDAIKQQVEHGDIRVLPSYTPEGKADGFHAVLMPARWGEEQMPAGTAFNIAVPDDDKPGYFKRKEVQTSAPISRRQLEAYNDAADTKINDAALAQHKIETEEAQKEALAKQENANASLAPAKRAELESAAGEHAAKTREADANTKQIQSVTGGPGKKLEDFSAPIQADLKGLADYTIDPQTFPTRINAKAGQMDRETAVGLTKTLIDPEYNENEYKNRSKLRQSFTSGKDADNIKSLNTVIHHIAQMNSDIKALNNGKYPILNWAGNTLSTATGGDAPSNFNVDATAVESELATLFKGMGATDQEIKAWRASFRNSASPKTLYGAVDRALSLAGGRMDALHQKWSEGMKRPREFGFLSDDSRRILKEMGKTSLIARDDESRANNQATAPPAAPAPAPKFQAYSSDGKWGYDGKQWVAVPQAK